MMRDLFEPRQMPAPPPLKSASTLTNSDSMTRKLLEEEASCERLAEKRKKKKPGEEWNDEKQQQQQSASESNVILKSILKVAVVLALLCVYNQLVVYQVETRLRRELLRVSSLGGLAAERQGEQNGTTSVRLARYKRETRDSYATDDKGELDNGDDDDEANEDEDEDGEARQAERPDRWLLDYLTGNSQLEERATPGVGEGRKNNSSSKKRKGDKKRNAAQCLCPAGTSSFISLWALISLARRRAARPFGGGSSRKPP